jgi:hypothetical protein
MARRIARWSASISSATSKPMERSVRAISRASLAALASLMPLP